MQLSKLAGVSEAGLDHFYKVLRVTAQWELIDESPEGKMFSPNASTRELVRGKEASLGHFVDHQVCPLAETALCNAGIIMSAWAAMCRRHLGDLYNEHKCYYTWCR